MASRNDLHSDNIKSLSHPLRELECATTTNKELMRQISPSIEPCPFSRGGALGHVIALDSVDKLIR